MNSRRAKAGTQASDPRSSRPGASQKPANAQGVPAKKNASGLIGRTDAVKMLAPIVGDKPNAITKRIEYAVKVKKNLRRASPGRDIFAADEFGAWAAGRWPQHASAITTALGVKINLQLQGRISQRSKLCGSLAQAPGTLADCQAVVIEQASRIDRLEREVKALREECERLQPFEAAKVEERRKRSAAGKEGGRGNKKEW